MASYTWFGPAGGNWSDAANWMPNGVPGSTDTALVNLAGSYGITLDVSSIGSLTLDAPGVTITPSTALTLAGVLDVQAGTFTVSNTITGGTIRPDGGTIDYAGGTLDGVTLAGPLDLSANGARVSVENGITFTGTAPEQIIDTGTNSILSFDDTETLNNVAVTLGGTSGDYSYINTGPSLTLGASSTLTTENGVAYINGTSLDNQGSITAATGNLVDSANITNQGSIAISDGSSNNTLDYLTNNTGTISVSGTGTGLGIVNAVNSGSIGVTNDATLTTTGTLDNTSGTIIVSSGATLDLQSTETDAQLGTIQRNGASLTLGGTLTNTGSTLDITSGSTLDGARLAGTIIGGTIKLDGGTIDYAGGTLDGVTLAGPLDLSANDSRVSIENGITFTGTAPEQIIDTGSDSRLSFDVGQTFNNVDISLGDSVGQSSLYLSSGTVLAASSTLMITGDAYLSDDLDNQGTITAATGDLDEQGDLTNEGHISVSDGIGNNTLELTSNTGTISVSGAGTQLDILNSSGPADIGATSIANNATLFIADPVDNLGTVSFLDHTGTLVLDSLTGGYDGTLDLFQSGDAVDLAGTGYSLNHVGDTLTLSQDGSVVDRFALAGQDCTNATFTLTADPYETILTTDAPCFCAGTMILTDRGECAVESLQVGDRVITLRDGIETPMSIRWLGQRRVVVARHPDTEHVDPIRIGRDAIAPGVPAHDLHVSPDHALYVDGMLIQARQLVNGITITRDTGRAVVTYHHVELERHAVLIADGMPCESYLDGGNRGQFDNQGIVVPLHPQTGDLQPCAPLVTDAMRVRPIWQRLAERAQAAGHVTPVPELEPDLLPWLETMDGTRLAPCGDGLRFALPPGCTQVRLRSASDRPTALAPWSDDRRRLGVAVRGVTLCRGRWRQEIALDQSSDGWWPVERAGDLAWRWTNGDGHITLPEAAEAIEITLHATMPIRARSTRAAMAAA